MIPFRGRNDPARLDPDNDLEFVEIYNSTNQAVELTPEDMSLYHNLPEMVGEVQQAAVDHPDIVEVFSIGQSHQGRDIWAARISDNVAEDEDEPESFGCGSAALRNSAFSASLR